MDRKDWILIIALGGLMLAWGPIVNKLYPPRPLSPEEMAARQQQKQAATQNTQSSTPKATPDIGPATVAPQPVLGPDPAYAEAAAAAVVENDLVSYDIVAERGGGIRSCTFKTHKGVGDAPLRTNDKGHGPVFQYRGLSPENDLSSAKISRQGSGVLFENRIFDGVTLTRSFEPTSDYNSRMTFVFTNKSDRPETIPAFMVNCGTGAPVHENDMPMYIGADWYDGATSTHKMITDFQKSGFLFLTFREARSFIEEAQPLDWLTSRNQFFVTLVDLKEEKFAGYRLDEVALPKFRQQQAVPPTGVTSWGVVQGFALPAGASKTLTFEAYCGPREYWRLDALGGDKDLVMDFGFWSWVSVPLLNLMNFIHKFVGNYGVAIILMVIVIKSVFWPLQSKANKTMKQMQAMQPKLKEIQEKFKNDPTKLQMEMMDLYRNYGINPMGGCLPMLVQIPVFFGFYSMLQTAVELRNASFLWAHDLSQPDTVAHMPGLDFPINPLPLLMGATSVWQMNITPNTSMDKTQAMMLKIMPIFFVFICYNFSSALALYWTVQNLIGVAQMYHNLSEPAPKLEKVKQRPKTRWAALVESARQQADAERQKHKKR